MSTKTAARSGWLLAAITLVCLAIAGYLSIRNGPVAQPNSSSNPILNAVVLTLLAFAIMGALIVARQPGNAIGWIFSVTALLTSVGALADGYAERALVVAPGSLHGGLTMAWLAYLFEGPLLFSVVIFVLLLFPDGRPLSPRWRWVVGLAVFITIAEMFVMAFIPGPLNNSAFDQFTNPFGVSVLAGWGDQLNHLLSLLTLALIPLSMVSLVLRYRRSAGAEREQIKWLASASVLIALALLAGPVIWFTPALSSTPLWPVLFVTAVTLIPVSVGIAILKYRLYDIDLIIRKTLSYAILTALLALVYFGSVVLLQEFVGQVFGVDNSPLAIVISTLVIAALFTPLRRHIQDWIDRRFFRKKYDAQQVLAQFALTARDETDLDALTAELVRVVQETMQPERVTIWLKR
ncbi:MAG: hypothetical protein R2844_05480 [Caldilineales bacterium]